MNEDADDLDLVNAWWRAANFLAVGQIYLKNNPLLREPLAAEHVKPRLLGHWGTTPGQTFLWAHLNRVARRGAFDPLFVCGPGHGGPAVVAAAWLEGTYSERYSHVTGDEEGMAALFRQFSYPGGIPSHVAPETPGSIHEGGELGYSLAHAYGAVFDSPDLLVACVVGDGEAETGPLATVWHANKFCHPVHDSTVLPVLHLNGYKIANPTVLARIPDDDLLAPFTGYGYHPYVMEAGLDEDHAEVHRRMADTMDEIVDEIARPGGLLATGGAAALAHADPAHAEGLDGTARGRRPPGRGHLPGAPGPPGRHAGERGAPRGARAVDALLPARGAVRRRRAAASRAGRAAPGRRPADERHAARQRR